MMSAHLSKRVRRSLSRQEHGTALKNPAVSFHPVGDHTDWAGRILPRDFQPTRRTTEGTHAGASAAIRQQVETDHLKRIAPG
jgi:hypothetical protein